MYYSTFRKDFYVEVPELARMTPEGTLLICFVIYEALLVPLDSGHATSHLSLAKISLFPFILVAKINTCQLDILFFQISIS